MSRELELCDECENEYLFTETEQDMGICGHCVDKLIERYRKRKEWEKAHDNESA